MTSMFEVILIEIILTGFCLFVKINSVFVLFQLGFVSNWLNLVIFIAIIY